MRISVATTACILNFATKRPFHMPQSTPTPTAASIARIIGVSATPSPRPPISVQTTAAEIATTAPTEISMPLVAMTNVMPRARMISEQERFRISMRRP